MAPEMAETTCCIVGGGPAGMMLGYLLARSGVRVTVLEKHKDFFRDFRGDTVHPSTLEVLKELDLLTEFLKVPHDQVSSLGVIVGDTFVDVADFRHVPTACKFVALMPQWDFLNFISGHASRFPSFRLLMEHEVTDLVSDGERIVGVKARHEEQDVEVRSDLVVSCDGRHSITRGKADLKVTEYGVPIDVLWFRISRTQGDPEQLLGNVNYGKALILINRSDYFQAGLLIQKGSYEQVQARGIEALRTDIRRIAPYLGERVNELENWEQIKILTVQINRLTRWHRPGLLCIGDAAHAMSPAGGVGINLAIQDAIAAANLLTEPLLGRCVSEADLAAVQRRREFPTAVTQTVQLLAHRALARAFESSGPVQAPWQLKVATRIPGVQRALGYAVGVGARPEHVPQKTQDEKRDSPLMTALCRGLGIAIALGSLGWIAWKAKNVLQRAA
jgi:2-polyprenyl-6-methoxyphenol hydroxylase-like FAD-dependent oxidoreductase